MAIDKGCTSGDLIGAGRKVLQAGLELCFYLMPGLGGRADAAVHVAGSARVIREVAQAAPADNPLVVRLRTAAVVPSTPLGAREAARRLRAARRRGGRAGAARPARAGRGGAVRAPLGPHAQPAAGARGLAAARPRAPHRAARRLPGLAARRPGGVRRRRAARRVPAARRLRRRAAPRRPSTPASTGTSSRAPTSCCRPRRRSAPATSEAGRDGCAAAGRPGSPPPVPPPSPRSPVRYRCTVGPTAATSSSMVADASGSMPPT